MPNFSVVLVEPQTPGNIGAVARSMGNFSLERLLLVDPAPIDDEAKARAMHAKEILCNAVIVDDLEELLKKFDMVIGTTGIHTEKEKKFLRKVETPERLVDSLKNYQGDVALVFGREDSGLSNEELKNCDRLVRIPSSEDYPILNLSHAVGIVLYEVFKEFGEQTVKNEDKTSESSERERLMEVFSNIMECMDYPEHKREKTEIMFRKILGRATLTKWEYHRLMGVFSQMHRYLKR